MKLNKKNIPWNKGLTKETDERVRKYSEKLSISQLGNHPTNAYKNGHKTWNKGLTKETDDRVKRTGESSKGRIFSANWKKNISDGHKGIKFSDEHRKNIGSSHKGLKRSEETKRKMKYKRSLQILPFKDTSIEIKIQNFLKYLKIEYFTHKYINIAHAYQCDIYIPSINLVIECDGNYWHSYPTGTEKDHIRTKELTEAGYKVLRLWESEIRKMNIEEFEEILQSKKFIEEIN